MQNAILAALMLIPLAAGAAEPPRKPDAKKPPADSDAWRERFEKRARMMRLLALSEALELGEEETLKMSRSLVQFDDRRRQLRKEIEEAKETLRQAAEGDAKAFDKVEPAAKRILDNKAALEGLEREMYTALAKDLTPQRRAKLALYVARPNDAFGMGDRIRPEHFGPHGNNWRQWRNDLRQRRGQATFRD